MRPLRIAFLDSWLQRAVDGSGTAAAIGGLGQALMAKGHHIARIGPTSAWPGNLTARRVFFNLYLPSLIQALPYDLVVGFDIDGFLLSGRLNMPYICSVKGVIAEELQHEQGAVRQLLWSLSRLERINARHAPLILTTSDYCRSRIAQHYGVAPSKVRLVPEGIDLARWNRLLPTTPGPDPEKPIILCVARQYPRKHVDDLLRAFALIQPRHPQAQLVIIGDGPEHHGLRALAAELGLGSQVDFLGGIPDDDEVLAWYRRSSIFCLPSVQEGFGIVYLEAMAAGLPIVATQAAAIPEVVPDRQAGILVPPGNIPSIAAALNELLNSPELRQKYGAFGQEHVKQYAWDRVADTFLQTIADRV